MRKIMLAATLLCSAPAIASVTITALPQGPFVEDHTDLFDVAVSGTTFIGGTGGYPTFQAEDAFGASHATSLEPGAYVFNDFIYPYQMQGLDFRTNAPVTISGFKLYLGSDPSGARQFDFMSLSGSTDNTNFALLESFSLSRSTYLDAYGSSAIRVQSSFAAGTYQYFRLVAHDRTGFEGGRILEFDAIAGSVNPGSVPEPSSWAMLVFAFGCVGAVMRRRNALRFA
jgi:hypothetical protein